MNRRHSKLTDWGLAHISIESRSVVLDVGCGGGRTVKKLAAIATEGKVRAIDYSRESVSMSLKLNKASVDAGRVQISEASVSHLPFSDNTFDVVTAVETHFWWPHLHNDTREVWRVLKPGGTLLVVAEIYKGAQTRTAKIAEQYESMSGMKLLTVDEHRALLQECGCTDVEVITEPAKGWICCIGRKAGA